MKPKKGLAVLAFFITPLFAQEDYVTITPAHPKHGEQITITYDPSAREAALKDMSEMELGLSFYTYPPERVEPMKFEGGKWTITFTVDDTTVVFQYLVFRFGDKVDDKKGQHWEFLLYGKDGRPVKGAYSRRSSLNYMRYPRDPQTRDSLIAEGWKKSWRSTLIISP